MTPTPTNPPKSAPIPPIAYVSGLAFGALFGLIQMLADAFILPFEFFAGLASLVGYCILLFFIVRHSARQGHGYGIRFLNGFLFSLAIGIAYGLVAGASGFIFADQIAEATTEGLELFGDVFEEEESFTALDEGPTPVANLVWELVAAPIFNAFWGALFSLAYAGLIKPPAAPVVPEPTTSATK